MLPRWRLPGAATSVMQEAAWSCATAMLGGLWCCTLNPCFLFQQWRIGC
uniref:Uncharacterized protein n=1 Tax=Manihot esculenta TaxID=3983 RepID=A0A2C9WFI6_MANES